jgi:transcriptional regulator CtsR
MRNIADVIEQFIISELFANEEDSINVKRSQLAEKLDCAPSQITYTLTTRFTPERGFEVESKRGNGGFIRIIRLPHPQGQGQNELPEKSSIHSAEEMVKALADQRMITARESRLLTFFLNFLGDHVTEKDKQAMIAQAFKALNGGN